MRSPIASWRLGAIAAAFLMMNAATGRATSTIVPDDYSTVQAAIDASGADTVYVHGGEYSEDVTLHRNLVLLAYPQDGAVPVHYEYPRIRSLYVTSNSGGGHIDFVRVIGFHFRGPVAFVNDAAAGNPEVTFEGCRMDAGFSATSGPNLFASVRLRGNVVLGSLLVSSLYYPSIVDNAVIGGGITARGNGQVVVEGNFVEGPGNVGLSICCSDGQPLAFDNVVRGFITGIRAVDGRVAGNRVTNCSGNAIEITRGSFGGTAWASDNIVKSCGGFGIRAYGGVFPSIVGNTIDSTGQAGIRTEDPSTVVFVRNNTVRVTGSDGIWADGGGAVSNNVVLRAAAAGIRTTTDAADSNVVGRCGGDGMRASSASLRYDTVYLNGGSGLLLSGGSGAAVDHDIAFGNQAYGLDATAASAPVLGCNDWYSNVAGVTQGISPAATDLAVDPQFCDVAIDVVTLAATSPLLTAPGCGRIGARALGCTSPTAVAPGPGGRRTFGAGPTPSPGKVLFWWPASDSRTTIELFDLQGARRFHASVAPGGSDLHWNGIGDDGRPVPSGVYFARCTAAGRVEAARVVIQR